MTKPIKPESADLSETITIRLSVADVITLDEITDAHSLAKRGAVAREAFRRGLRELFEETKKKAF